MSASKATVALNYYDASNVKHSITIPVSSTFTEMVDHDEVVAGAASAAIGLGTITTVDTLIVAACSGALTVRLDGETASGHALASGGFLAIQKASISAVKIAHAAAARYKVIALGA